MRQRRGIIRMADGNAFKIRKNGRLQIVIAPGTKQEEMIRVTPPRTLWHRETGNKASGKPKERHAKIKPTDTR